MTTYRQAKFEDSLTQGDKRLYSVNFLLARFTPIGDVQRALQMIENKLQCEYYHSRDFAVARFYKNISTPVGRFPPILTEDE